MNSSPRDTQAFTRRLNDTCDLMLSLSAELERLGRAFRTTGNYTLSNELLTYAEQLATVQNELGVAYCCELSETLQQSQRAYGETLGTLIDAARKED